MNTEALYNNTPTLFAPLKDKEEWKNFQIIDGHIYSPRNGYVARCKDSAQAAEVLTLAGFRMNEAKLWN